MCHYCYMTSSQQAQVPGFIRDYFGSEAVRADHPAIVQCFTPGVGWTRHPIRKRVSLTWLRKLAREGVTDVSVRCGARTADFTIREVVAYANRPLLGGRVI
jgi:hypothetical protein